MPTVTYLGSKYKIEKSPRKTKQLKVYPINNPSRSVHFGDPTMPEFPGTKRGDNYCARSFGIKGRNNPKSANFWSRKYLWNCRGKKSLKKKIL